MTNYPYVLFNKSPLQLRLIGARGGRAFGRNQRLRRALLPTAPPAAVPRRAPLLPTAAEAIALLDGIETSRTLCQKALLQHRRLQPFLDCRKTSQS
jgi:hypothetical protein